ncbi:MAG: scyllo-inosose 3-dehydrogenase [Ignisphaera sp.]|nr:scyllo-inosose 3-dehydrogenase [Ignisphaera sp.]MCX8167847.1 scyllo-inosose 3-dehydrogenase [Ignisphaera sp.]MDW8086121.1 scyllo-inosose 3-dehydrogenase [Ignisphaera sp.]
MSRMRMLAAVLHGNWVPRAGYTPSLDEESARKALHGSRVWRNPVLKLEDVKRPEVGPRQILVRVKSCGICGSDVHMYEMDEEGYMLYPGMVRLPVIIGHELSGVVEEVGSGVTEFNAGDAVTLVEMWYCGECISCRRGYFDHCSNLEEMGFTKDGGFAEYLVADARYAWKINTFREIYSSDEKVFEAGALVEPFSVAYKAIFIRAGGFMPGGYVVVYGAGPIGLAAVMLSKAAGAGKVVVFETVPERMELAKAAGADHTLNPIELEKKGVSIHEKILELTEGQGADLQVEAAGYPPLIKEMQKALAIGGKITWIGRADREASTWLEYFQIRSAQIYGSQGHVDYAPFMWVIRMIASGKVDPTKIVTARYRLSDIIKAMERARLRKDAKIHIKP